MARRKANNRVRYDMNVAFKEGQKNLPEVLTRLAEKVDRKQDASDLEQIVADSSAASASQLYDIQNQINDIQNTDSSTMPTDQITSTGVATYTISFDMTSESEANYDVSINGLVQDPLSDYTIDIDANTLTLTTAPAAGADIVITQRDTYTFDDEQAISDFLSALHS